MMHLMTSMLIWLMPGILDPAKVTRSALQNATSVASTLLHNRTVVATIQRRCSGNAGQAVRAVGNDVIPLLKHKNKYFLAER